MRKTLSVKEVSEIINKFRMNHQDQKFVRPQLIEALKELGIGGNIAQILITKLPNEVAAGKTKLYSMPKDPIHYRDIEACYKKRREYSKQTVKNNKPDLKAALEVAKEAGYLIAFPIFELDRLIKENPKLYRNFINNLRNSDSEIGKYIKYEAL